MKIQDISNPYDKNLLFPAKTEFFAMQTFLVRTLFLLRQKLRSFIAEWMAGAIFSMIKAV